MPTEFFIEKACLGIIGRLIANTEAFMWQCSVLTQAVRSFNPQDVKALFVLQFLCFPTFNVKQQCVMCLSAC